MITYHSCIALINNRTLFTYLHGRNTQTPMRQALFWPLPMNAIQRCLLAICRIDLHNKFSRYYDNDNCKIMGPTHTILHALLSTLLRYSNKLNVCYSSSMCLQLITVFFYSKRKNTQCDSD